MATWHEYKTSQLEDPEVKKEYNALEWEYALISAHQEAGMSQQELSHTTGITQADISRIENGKGNPSIKTLKKLAAALNKTLKIEFA